MQPCPGGPGQIQICEDSTGLLKLDGVCGFHLQESHPLDPLLEQWLLQGRRGEEGAEQDRHQGPATLALLLVWVAPQLGHQLTEELIPKSRLVLCLPYQERANGLFLPGLQGSIPQEPQHLLTQSKGRSRKPRAPLHLPGPYAAIPITPKVSLTTLLISRAC